MRRLISVAVVTTTAILMSVPTAEAGGTFHGTYTGARLFCQGTDVTEQVVQSVSGTWNLNIGANGAKVISAVFFNGKLHAAAAFTGWFQLQPSADNDPAGGYYHYQLEPSEGAIIEATLDRTTGPHLWTYHVYDPNTFRCLPGPDQNAPYDEGVMTGPEDRG